MFRVTAAAGLVGAAIILQDEIVVVVPMVMFAIGLFGDALWSQLERIRENRENKP